MRKRKDGGLSIITISKMLENLKSPKSYTSLRMCSTPRFKQRFNVYLNWLKKKELVNYSKEVELSGCNVIEYQLSQKGWNLLDLIV